MIVRKMSIFACISIYVCVNICHQLHRTDNHLATQRVITDNLWLPQLDLVLTRPGHDCLLKPARYF